MKGPWLALIGFLTLVYLFSDAFNGHLRYSFPGVLGTDVYGMASRSGNFLSYPFFMDIVYFLSFLIAFAMLYAGLKFTATKKGH